ncbi:MAG: type IX secretion system membrane protein PorP/SprF [Bacteroidetes bacterium]|nr:MAG: type IX secretion system membrane protein PorP/SprF [Bacteroidota bacterium]
MKKTLLICLAFFPLSLLFGQQEPLFAQYKTNAFLLNPAVAGSSERHELRINYRRQWSRFPGAPETAIISYHGSVDVKNAVGLLAFNDALGPTKRSGLQFAYAFHIPIGMKEDKLALGMAAKMMQYRFDSEGVYFQDPSDAAIAEAAQGLMVGDVAFGLYYYNEHFFAGFSAPNLIQTDLDLGASGSSRSIVSKLYRHYFALMGYKFEYENFSVEPSVLVKKVQTAPYQIEGTVKMYIVNDRIYFGGSYRTDWRMSLLFGFHTRNLHFTYSADFMSKPIEVPGTVFGPSSEITLGLDLGGTRW